MLLFDVGQVTPSGEIPPGRVTGHTVNSSELFGIAHSGLRLERGWRSPFFYYNFQDSGSFYVECGGMTPL